MPVAVVRACNLAGLAHLDRGRAPRRPRPSVLVDRHRPDRDLPTEPVARIARSIDDLVDDVHALRDLAEQRVVLRQAAGEIGLADEELAAIRVRAGVGHRHGAAHVVALDALVRERVARSAGTDATGVQRRLLAVLAVACLGDEARDDAVEHDVVVEALLGEVDEVLRGLGRRVREQVELDVAELGGEGRAGHWLLLQGVATVTEVMTTGLGGGAPTPAAIASTVPMPVTTLPK